MAHKIFEKGYIQVYTGNGKGKTTAAIGVTMRTVAAGMDVFFGQFMKNTPSGEHLIFHDYRDRITFMQFGTGRFIRGKPGPEDFEKAAAGWKHCREAILSKKYDLIVLDEINLVIKLQMLDIKEVLSILNQKAEQTEIILTGRNAPEEIINVADLVTEMTEIKHYYTKGVPARKGIEE